MKMTGRGLKTSRKSGPTSPQAAAGRVGGLSEWATDREGMLRITAQGNDALMQRSGNKSAIRLHFIRLAKRRWEKQKGATP
jgi:hypothetical protein